jgi:Tol biopolymer transport system component
MTFTHLARNCVVAITLAFLVVALPSAQSASEPELLFREALHKQQVDGDLEAAIKLYQRIVSTRNANRTLVARALLQLGDCYERQGNAEARRTYERLVREFGDQGDAVRLARARLVEITPRGDVRRDVTVRRLGEWRALRFISSVSRDGRYAAVGGGEGPPAIASKTLLLLDLSSGTSREVGKGKLVPPDQFILSSAVSPDGSRIAYTMTSGASDLFGPSELRIVGTASGEPRTLLRHSKALGIVDWSRDGSTLLLAEVSGFPGPVEGFHQMNVATGQIKPVGIPVHRVSVIPFGFARLSPDARFVAYAIPERNDQARAGVFVDSLDGSRPRRITRAMNFSYPVGWSPDGKHLLYVGNESGSNDLWSVRIQNGDPIGEPASVKRAIGRIDTVGVDDAGRLFHTLVTLPSTAYLGELDLAASRVGNLQPVTTATPRGVRMANLTWSPDGTRIRMAHEGFADGLPHMWVRDVATGREREITLPDGYAFQPNSTNWTPDGKSFVMLVQQGAESKLAWLDVDSGAFRIGPTLPSASRYLIPVQSLDGGHVFALKVLDQLTRATSLVRIDVNTGGEHEFCRGRGDLSVSPDYSSAACFDDGVIRIVSLQGGAVRNLVKTEAMPFPVKWTPDSRFLIYFEPPALAAKIVPVAGGDPKRLDIPGGSMNVSFHPNGRQVAIMPGGGTTELWVLENLKLD